MAETPGESNMRGAPIPSTENPSPTGHSSPSQTCTRPDGRETNGIVPIMRNVVATIDVGVALDLKNIAMRAKNAEYNPKRFSALIMRIKEPRTTALIFCSGKIVVTGAKSIDASMLASRKFAKILRKVEYMNASVKTHIVQNMVASFNMGDRIMLEKLASQHYRNLSYEPELFPGLIYRLTEPTVVLLVFFSGKVVITGGKRPDDIYNGFRNMYPVLYLFREQAN